MSIYRLIAVSTAVLFVALSAAGASAEETQLARLESLQPAIPQYILGSGDKVRVTVYGEDDLSGEYAVDGNGYIALPLVGDVKAAGLSAPQLQTAVENAYGNGYLNEPRVAVEVTTYRPFTIIGQVERPGQYSYVNGMSVVNAVAMAGGYTPEASEDVVYIRHEGDTKQTRVDTDQNIQVRPGDVVYVERTTFWSLMSVATPITAILGAARYGIP
jgi:protein involved in polysaccharide export with SLBB domain